MDSGPLVEGQSLYSLSHFISLLSNKNKESNRRKLEVHLARVPCSMRLDSSAGDTSMKRRKEKQLPLSSPGTVKTEYRMKNMRLNKERKKLTQEE